MRPSVAPQRQPNPSSSAPNAAAATKLLEKKKEFEAVLALDRASAQFLKRIESLADDFDNMADAGTGASHAVWNILYSQTLMREQCMGMFSSSGQICSRF
jgi:hypothetical protein